MAVILDIRNPTDLTNSYDVIEIQRHTANLAAGMVTIINNHPITTSTASDLSTGYTTYNDSAGDVDLHWYRFRYRNQASLAVSAWSDIYRAGGSVIHTRFRRAMRDTNPNNYFFTDEDIETFLSAAIGRLYPTTWFETWDDTAFVPNGSTVNFPFPVGVTRVNSVSIIDSSGYAMGNFGKYRTNGRYLVFDRAPSSGIRLRAWVEKMFTKFSEVPDVWDDHILNLMKLQAFEMMEADRMNYYKYNAVVKGDGGNLPSLDRTINRLQAQIRLRETQLRRVRRPASIRLV